MMIFFISPNRGDRTKKVKFAWEGDDLHTVVNQIQQTLQNINTRINSLEHPSRGSDL
jgi:hypothetical protein